MYFYLVRALDGCFGESEGRKCFIVLIYRTTIRFCVRSHPPPRKVLPPPVHRQHHHHRKWSFAVTFYVTENIFTGAFLWKLGWWRIKDLIDPKINYNKFQAIVESLLKKSKISKRIYHLSTISWLRAKAKKRHRQRAIVERYNAFGDFRK